MSRQFWIGLIAIAFAAGLVAGAIHYAMELNGYV